MRILNLTSDMEFPSFRVQHIINICNGSYLVRENFVRILIALELCLNCSDYTALSDIRSDIYWELERMACLIVTYYLDFDHLNLEETFKNSVRNSQGSILNLNFGIFQIPISTVHITLRNSFYLPINCTKSSSQKY